MKKFVIWRLALYFIALENKDSFDCFIFWEGCMWQNKHIYQQLKNRGEIKIFCSVNIKIIKITKIMKTEVQILKMLSTAMD